MKWDDAKLHVGCGDRRLSSWINADAVVLADVQLDLYDLSQIPCSVLSHIYWSHGPEHIYPDKLVEVLVNLRARLRAGGVLTTATIDLVGIWRNRFQTQANGAAWNAALYGESDSTHHPYLAHRQCFTHESLTELLLAAGFVNVKRWEPEQYPDILSLNDYATSCRLVTVHLEGTAP